MMTWPASVGRRKRPHRTAVPQTARHRCIAPERRNRCGQKSAWGTGINAPSFLFILSEYSPYWPCSVALSAMPSRQVKPKGFSISLQGQYVEQILSEPFNGTVGFQASPTDKQQTFQMYGGFQIWAVQAAEGECRKTSSYSVATLQPLLIFTFTFFESIGHTYSQQGLNTTHFDIVVFAPY